ncbi:hypothetical protein D3C72_131050 [compost metagenome]
MSRIFIAVTKPRPIWPRTFSLGTRTFRKKSSRVSEPLMPILGSLGPCSTPKSRSTRNAVTPPLAPSAGSVTAKTVKRSAVPPLVIQILLPLRIQSPLASRSARVLMAAASEPAPGSVRAKAASISPEAILGRYFCFCSSVPSRTMP